MSKKKTQEEFKNEVHDLVKDEYTVLGNYINNKTKIKMKHNKCGHIYEVRPTKFLSGNRCPYCCGSMKKTTEQFKQEVKELVGNEYKVLDEYKNNKTKIKIKHVTCGNIYEVRPDDFLHGNRCPQCFGNIKKTHEQFKNGVYDSVGDEYTFLEDYKGIDTKIKVRHNACGNEYLVTPYKFFKGRRCPKCRIKERKLFLKKSNEQFKKEVFYLVGDEYTFLEEYIKDGFKIKVRHNKCGHEYMVTPSMFLRGTRCPKCYGTHKKTTDQFKKEVFDLVNEEYEVIGEYVKAHVKIKMKHNKCGNEYEVRPHDFIRGNRCPQCTIYKGEEKIAGYLKKFGIKYETQKTFDDLVHLRPLRFDFYLPDKNLLIEYDGEQHFRPVDFSGSNIEQAEENFKNQQIRDKMKNDYCKENVVNLLRIKYTDFDKIRKILKEELIKT